MKSWSKLGMVATAAIIGFGVIAQGIAPVSVQAANVAAQQQPAETKNAKYVFLFIGDGMGVAQRDSAELYLASTNGAATGEWQQTKLLMNTLPVQGMTTTYDAGAIITDSASAGTAMATGHKTLSGVISMSPDKKEKYPTIAEIAKKNGWKIGIVSSVSLDHATPAVFYAHNSSRKNMYDIGEQLVKSKFDYFAGGGFVQPTGSKGANVDNLVFAAKAGYTIADDRAEFEALKAGDDMVIAMDPILDADKAMYYEMDRAQDDISLAEYTRKGIELLDNEDGFFMMVEGGKIDWACHANDAAASIQDTLAFDQAIQEAYAFYEKHPEETLIIVTGDHETGGMAIGYAGTQYTSFFDKINHQDVSYIEFGKQLDAYREKNATAPFEQVLPLIEESFGLVALPAADVDALKAAVAAGKAEGATDADKQAAKEASEKLGLLLNDAELAVLKTAYAESMKAKDQRDTSEMAYLMYGGYEPLVVKLTTILNNKAGIGWTTYSHTGAPVQTSAVGVGSELFGGYYDNTDIFSKMMTVAGFQQ